MAIFADSQPNRRSFSFGARGEVDVFKRRAQEGDGKTVRMDSAVTTGAPQAPRPRHR